MLDEFGKNVRSNGGTYGERQRFDGNKAGQAKVDQFYMTLTIQTPNSNGTRTSLSEYDADPGSGSGRGNLPGHCSSAYVDRCGPAAIVDLFLHSSVRSCIFRTGELPGSGV